MNVAKWLRRADDDDEAMGDPLDDAVDFPLSRSQEVIRRKAWVKRQMMPTWQAILDGLTEYARTLKWEKPR